MTLKSCLPALGLLGALATSASAQSGSDPSYLWVFPGVEFSACVEFLMAPDMAAGHLTEGFRAIPASSVDTLSPVLHREVEGNPELGSWVPAQLCFIESPSIISGEARYTAEGKMGTRELIGYWAIAGTREAGTPTSDQWFVVRYWTNDWRVRKQTEAAFIPMLTFKRSLVTIPGSTTQNYTVTIGKTVLTWKGQMAGRDSSVYAEARSTSQIFDGKRAIHWTATASSSPQWLRHLPGVFNVQGKDDLAQALKASPIRMFGPMYWGGDARVEFTRPSASGAQPGGG